VYRITEQLRILYKMMRWTLREVLSRSYRGKWKRCLNYARLYWVNNSNPWHNWPGKALLVSVHNQINWTR